MIKDALQEFQAMNVSLIIATSKGPLPDPAKASREKFIFFLLFINASPGVTVFFYEQSDRKECYNMVDDMYFMCNDALQEFQAMNNRIK